jgi:hypothetical protein
VAAADTLCVAVEVVAVMRIGVVEAAGMRIAAATDVTAIVTVIGTATAIGTTAIGTTALGTTAIDATAIGLGLVLAFTLTAAPTAIGCIATTIVAG